MCPVAKPEPGKFLKAMAHLVLAYILLSLVIIFGVLSQHKRELDTVDIPHSLKPADYVPTDGSDLFRGIEREKAPYYSTDRKGTAI